MHILLTDLRRYANKSKLGIPDITRIILTDPGAMAVAIFRIQQWSTRYSSLVARLIRSLNHFVTGVDISVGAQIGPGLKIVHASGIVIGSNVRIGNDAIIYQGVTLGRRHLQGDDQSGYPTIGDSVILCAQSSVVGPVRIGSNVIVGAHSLVLTDVPSGTSAVGVPARVL